MDDIRTQYVESDDDGGTLGRFVRSDEHRRLLANRATSKHETAQQIVERQMKAWSLEQARRRAHSEAAKPWPLITISREYEARGTTIADAIADRTGFSVWDTGLVHAVAEQIGADPRILESLDEKHRTAIEDAIQGALNGTAYTRSDYLKGLTRVVHTISAHGGSIIVGRGANLLLDPSRNLRVRLVAPIEDRIRWHSENSGLSEREARRIVEKVDKERAKFIHDHFKRDVNNSTMYDLVLNASMFPVHRLVETVLFAYDTKFGRQPEVHSEVSP